MDVRLSPEQQALRDSAGAGRRPARRARGRASSTTPSGPTKLDAAVRAAGWRELRAESDTGGPWASGVEVAIVAEELGRGLADAPFVGPTLAAELRRLAGAPAASDGETVVLDRTLGALAGRRPGRGRRPARSPSTPAGPRPGCSSASGRRTRSRWRSTASAIEVDLTRPSIRRSRPAAAVGRSPDARRSRSTTTRDAMDRARARAHVRRPRRRDARRGRARHRLRGRASSVRRGGRLVPGGAAPARRRARRRPRVARASRSTRRGPSTRSRRPTRSRPARSPRPTAPAPPASVCETAIQVHGGIGNTWECLAHVYLRRALLSIDVLGGVGPSLTARARAPRDRGRAMDFADAPDEAEFRERLRAWLDDEQPGPAGVVDRRRLLARPGRVAPVALRRRVLRAVVAARRSAATGCRPRSTSIVDDELAAAGAPPRPGLGYLVQGILEHGNDDIRAPVPARHRQRSRPVVPGLQRARRRLRPRVAAHPRRPRRRRPTSSRVTRCGRATPTTPTGACCSPAPTTTSRSTRASPRSPCRWTSPASSGDRCG